MTLRTTLLSVAAAIFCVAPAVQAQLPMQSSLPPIVQAHLRALQQNRPTLRPHDVTPTGGTSALIETIAGSAPFQKPVNALQTCLGAISAITEDTHGNLYIALAGLGTVVKVDTSGNTAVFAGAPLATGPALVQSGDGGPALAAHIPDPSGLAVDNNGDVFISDTMARTIREVDSKTGIIQTIAGIPGSDYNLGNPGDGGPATQADLLGPTDLALDGNGNLYVVDGSLNLRQINLATGIIQTVAGNSALLSPTCQLTASTTCAGSTIGNIVHVATASGHIYFSQVSDSIGIGVGSIGELDPATWTAQLVAGGAATAGTSATYPGIGSIIYPNGLATDKAGNLFFTDLTTLQVREILATDHSVHAVAGTGTIGPAGDGGPALAARINYPGPICFSPTRGFDFADGYRVRSFVPGGNITAFAGNGYANDFGDGGPATSAGLDEPSNLVSDSQGNLYVSEDWGDLVRRIDAHTGIITTIAGSNHENVAGDGGAATAANLEPSGLAIDETGHRLFVNDIDAIRAVDLDTGILSTVASTSSDAGDLIFDGNHTLYLPDGDQTDQVVSVDTVTGETTVIAGDGPGGSFDQGILATGAFLGFVEGLALDDKGTLYIADYGQDDVRNLDLATDIINDTAGGVTPIFGNNTYTGDGGPAIDATLNGPAGIAYGNGDLAIVDIANELIRQVDLKTGIITTLAGAGAPGFSGDGGPASHAMFNFIQWTRLTFDPSGNLYIADTLNDRIRRIVLHPTKLNATITATDSALTATYNNLAFGIAPTGTVTFLSGTTTVGTAKLTAATDGSDNYIASVNPSSALTGTTITAQYSGDGNYAALTTTAAWQPPTPTYTISATPASLTIKQGASGNVTFTVTPENGFNQAIAFTCDSSTLPTGATCSFSPASVTPAGAPVTTTLTLKTSAAATAALHPPAPHASGWFPRGGAVLALLLFGFPGIRRRARLAGLAAILCALCLGASLTGCGGSGSNSSGSGSGSQSSSATPAGSYKVTVTASAGATSTAQPLTVNLTVTD